MSNYSVELDSLIDESNLNQAAIFTAAGILIDSIHRYDENDVYSYSLDLASRSVS
jgi:5'(3')-deoxyribonucleotidase